MVARVRSLSPCLLHPPAAGDSLQKLTHAPFGDKCCITGYSEREASAMTVRPSALASWMTIPAECRHANRFHSCFLSFSPLSQEPRREYGVASRKDCMACVAASFNAWGAWRCATVATTCAMAALPLVGNNACDGVGHLLGIGRCGRSILCIKWCPERL